MSDQADRNIGRYVLFDEIAAGGMATVHLAKLKGPVGFSRTVAIKRLHPEYARDPQFVSMFLDEARLASRVRHPNVVPTLDVVTTAGQLYLVMEYVQGAPLASLLDATSAKGTRVPPDIVAAIVTGALMGLHAAHEAQDEDGENLGIVHRDVSPSNVLVGVDGMPRVLDFGVAKAAGRMHNTRGNVLKGTLGYIAPEQFNQITVDRRADIYSASVMLWEALCGQPLFEGETEYAIIAKALFADVPMPSSVDPSLAPFDEVVMKGLDREPDNRYDTAREMALLVEKCVGTASNNTVAEYLNQLVGDGIAERARVLAQVESGKGRRVSEIRAAMLDVLDLEDVPDPPSEDEDDDEAPATDPTAAKDARPAAVTMKPVKTKSTALRIGLGVVAIAVVAGVGLAWKQTQGTSAALPETQPDAEVSTSADTVAAAAPPDPVPEPTPAPVPSSTASSATNSAPDGSALAAPDSSAPEPSPSTSTSPPPPFPPTGPRTTWPTPPKSKPTSPKPTGKKPWDRDRYGH